MMSGRGGPAQARRRERRAKMRQQVSPEPVVDAAGQETATSDAGAADQPTALVAAAGDIVWAPEDSFNELLGDLNGILNPSGDWDFPMYVYDVSIKLDQALICDWGSNSYYVSPITVGDEPTLGPRSEWIEVESAWVESDDEFAARLRAFIATHGEVADGNVTAAGWPNVKFELGNFTITSGTNGTNVTADGATSPDIPVEHQEAETLPSDEPDATNGGMSWTAMIVPEGDPTDDSRIFAPGGVSWRELPLSLGAMLDTPHADVVTASPVIGRIDRIYREGNLIKAEGIFDESEQGREIARMVGDGTLRGVSVDIAVVKMEIAYRSDVLDADGNWIGGDEPSDDNEGPSMIDILFGETEDEIMFVVWEGIIGAVTICPFPAFADAKIEVAKSLVAAPNPMMWTITTQHGMTVVAGDRSALVASAVAELPEGTTKLQHAPLHPPREWFEDPVFDELTPLAVEDDGRVYGHAAAWDVCHIGIPGVCTTAPQSPSGYAYFHLKEVVLEDGERLSCGTITLDTGHADRRLGRADTSRHYDDTGTAVADIVCGEDEYGIWFAGALRSTVNDETLRKLRGAVLSGDWRDVNGSLEFVALLAVNVPGFPVPRTRAMVASGHDGPHVLALVAAGIHAGEEAISRSERAQLDMLRDIAEGAYADLAARADG